MEELTEKQRLVFDYIAGRLEDNEPPAQREIAEYFRLAQNSIYQIIGYLRKKGYLAESTGHRGLRLSREYLQQAAARRGLPVVGRVAAGEPVLAEQNIETYVDIARLLKLSDDVFLLRVSGDSMIDEGIMDGDLVAVNPTPNVSDGDIAVVLLDDEATVKRVYFKKDRIGLKPANRAAGYRMRYVKRTEKNIRIIGKVTGCIRSIQGGR